MYAMFSGVALSLVVLIGFTIHLLRTADEALHHFDTTLTELPGLIDERAAHIEVTAVAAVDRNMALALKPVNRTASLVDRRTWELVSISYKLADRLADTLDRTRSDVKESLTTANTTAASLSLGVTSALKPLQSSAQQVNDALPLYLDCDHNPDCAFNRFQGVSKSVEKMSSDGAKAMRTFDQKWPELLGTVDAQSESMLGISENVRRFTDRAVAPCKGWCLVRSIITTSSGAVRAAGAAGVF